MKSLTTAAAIAMTLASTYAFETFTGAHCAGTPTSFGPCSGECVPFTGQNSFKVESGSSRHCVVAYQKVNCGGTTNSTFLYPNQNGTCANVSIINTTILSVRCLTDNTCLSGSTVEA